ncbi:protein NRT1/ PTR FAMILY 5.9-like [Neltuma alba]|uniref:protein NRT1/ PTR FAMILY 5.9-like n=1 Tax=Neltuma alba TaxID=207710 RepID=UPI0010A510A2|nr:protein NRT1/ PTR FAMILY 5.9-like [Prosopis alba]
MEAAILTNLVDMISEVLKVAITHVSDTYTGPFTVVIFCAAAYAMGLILLEFRGMLIFAIVLIALGTAGEEPTSDFLDSQLTREEVNKKRTKSEKKQEDNDSTEERKYGPGFLWHFAASFIGGAIAIFWLGNRSWPTRFEISSLVMEIMCLLFFWGIFWYYPESQTMNNGESSNKNDADAESEDRVVEPARKEEQVRDLKSLCPPIVLLGFTFIGYSLVLTCGNTYFVMQTDLLDSNMGEFDVPIIVFFVLQSSVASVVRLIQSRYKLMEPIRSMAVGMFCSILCVIAAWLVECRRLCLIQFITYPCGSISLSIWFLTPQYVLLGLMEGFAEFGLESFLHNQLIPESMRKFVYPCISMLFVIGTFFSMLEVSTCQVSRKGGVGRTSEFERVQVNIEMASSSSSDAQPGEAASHVNQDQLRRSNTIIRKNSQPNRQNN